jgi:hypothetical protein
MDVKPEIFLLLKVSSLKFCPISPAHPFLLMIWQPIQIRGQPVLSLKMEFFYYKHKKDQPYG